jgi:hypothetical protein
MGREPTGFRPFVLLGVGLAGAGHVEPRGCWPWRTRQNYFAVLIRI